ncbi:MAG TPA: M28 family metallopeptidase [Acidobacteriota bacterium]
MKLRYGAVILFLALTSYAQSAPDSRAPIAGFSSERQAQQRQLESKFDSLMNRDNLRQWMKRLSARPHHVGSPYGRENAQFIRSLFQSWGYKTEIKEYRVLFPTPKQRVLEMLEPTSFAARLQEPPLNEDSTSGQTGEQLPVYNAYSIDGDVTAPLVYVNYGVPRDYDELEQRGIDVKGKIVIARYGASWRGIKPKVAAEHGAIGCIIYSDPRDDGYFQGDVYPKGAYRNDSGAQRGSVADMPVYSGDPLTPFVAATENAKRLALKDTPTLTKIPVLPVSYGDALPLLKALEGPVAPAEWRGALPITYHIGPGPARVRLKVEFNWDLKPAYDVIASLPGNELPDQWIIRGNHHDAWVNGAEDPVSGLVALLEEARAIGELARSGWKPRRTIIYAAWDAEEPGLLGSTEWVEDHAEVLKEKAAVYINSDSNGRGFLNVGGSHTLEKFVNEVARDVVDPEKKVSVLERALARRATSRDPETRAEPAESRELRIGALGSGSDYTPFLQHLGIASLNIGYGGEDGGGVYHSIYDSFDHYTRFVDPTFEYGIALAETGGRLVLRLAGADVLPFEFSRFADTVGRYVREVVKLADDMRSETEQLNRKIREKTLELVADPTQTFVVPKPKSAVPFVNFAPLQNAVARLRQSVQSYARAMDASAGKNFSPDRRKELDQVLMKAEQALITSEGLPRRPWYVHQIYAPGFYTGYGVKTLPGVREAIEQRLWQEAETQIARTARAIEAFSTDVDRAAALLR